MEITKKQYILEGLCCGNCAAKIQNEIQLLNGVKSAEINVESATLSIEFDTNMEALTKDIIRIAVSHDEDIVVKEA